MARSLLFASVIILGFILVRQDETLHFICVICRYLKPGSFLPTTTIVIFGVTTLTIDVYHPTSLIGQVAPVNVLTQHLMIPAMKHVQHTILRILTVNVSVIEYVLPLLS